MTKPLLTTLLLLWALPGTAQTGTIVLNVTGIQPKLGGDLQAGIFKQDNFPKVGKQFIGQVVAVSGATIRLEFKNVPAGEYGIAVYQDADRNKDLNTNFLGLPKEPIGFSNDARIKMGPPSFTDAKIKVENDAVLSLNIVLR